MTGQGTMGRGATSSIDELLGYDEDVTAPGRAHRPRHWPGSRSRSVIGWLARTLAYAAASGALVLFAMRLVELSVPYVLAFTAMLALLVIRRLLRVVAAPPRPRAAMARRSSAAVDEVVYQRQARDGLSTATGRWESRLEWGDDNADRFHRAVQRRLAELADERLRRRHGISRYDEPARARAILGEPLWNFLVTPAGRPPTSRELSAILTRMEEL